jgi:hypothetical protein
MEPNTKSDGQKGMTKGKNTLYHIPENLKMVEENIEVLDAEDSESQTELDDSVQFSQEDEVLASVATNQKSAAQEALAAIPGAVTPLRSRKRRAVTADQHSQERAERLKAARNLDYVLELGNNSTSHPSFLKFSNELVVGNLNVVGISLGETIESVKLLWKIFKNS